MPIFWGGIEILDELKPAIAKYEAQLKRLHEDTLSASAAFEGASDAFERLQQRFATGSGLWPIRFRDLRGMEFDANHYGPELPLLLLRRAGTVTITFEHRGYVADGHGARRDLYVEVAPIAETSTDGRRGIIVE